MGDTFRIEIDLKKFDLDSELEKYLKAVDKEMEASSRNIEAAAGARVATDLGGLKSVIKAQKIGPLDYEVVAPVAYAPAIEFGTGKNVKVPAGFEAMASKFIGLPGIRKGDFTDFVFAILDWMKRKGIRAGVYSTTTRRRLGNRQQKADEDLKLASAICYSILRNGIKPQPFLIPAFLFEQEQLLKRLSQIK